MEIKTLTVDLSKNFQHVCAFDKGGKLLSKKVYKPKTFAQLLANTKPCTVIMEACGGARTTGPEQPKDTAMKQSSLLPNS